MKTRAKVMITLGIVGIAGAWYAGHSRHDVPVTAGSWAHTTLAQKVSDQDRKAVNGNLQRAFVPASQNASTTLPRPTGGNLAQVEEVQDLAAVDALRDFELCLEARNPCDIPQTEPRSSDIWVTDQAVHRLQALRSAFMRLAPQEQEQVRADLEPATMWALNNNDDNIREEGLYLARLSLAPEPRVRAVIESLKESVSAPLYDVGLRILREQKDVLRQEQENFFVETMRTGGFYASEEVARQVLPYLNDENILRFVQLRAELPPESSTATYLSDNIKEYRMISQGG